MVCPGRVLPVYSACMTQTRREWLPHIVLLAATVLSTAFLAFWPEAIDHAGYQCMLHTLTGLRCPFCGMTRDFAALLHGGHVPLNPCSRATMLAIYGFYPAALLTAWRTGRLHWFHSRAVRIGVVVALGLMMVANNWH